MKVLLINTYDIGGAATACLRLHQGFLEEGISSKVLLKQKRKRFPMTFQMSKTDKKKTVLEKAILLFSKGLKVFKISIVKSSNIEEQTFLSQRDKSLEIFSFPNSDFDITQSNLYLEADIINLHWTANFLDYKSFFEKNKKPVIWTLHDMNPFLGGEHYSEKYSGINEAGLPVTRKLKEEEILKFNEILKIKQNALKEVHNLHILSLCDWMTEEVKKSDFFNVFPIYNIPNGIDSEVFLQRDQAFSRSIFNIPENKKVLLFVADSIDNYRKGYIFLKRALDLLNRDDVILCSIGHSKGEFVNTEKIIELGPIYDERLMSMAYSAADVFVIPSLMDNLPNTMLESLMCGTPVIGFPVGGILDTIKQGENGLIASEISVNSLLETLNEFLNSKSFDREAIREDAVKKYDLKIVAKEYRKLFDIVLNKNK